MAAAPGLVLRIALRNLFASTLNIIIGLFIGVGAMLLVIFSGLLGSIDSAMSRSIIGSVAGHIQVYSAKSKDPLSVYGAMGGEADLSAIESFSELDRVIRSVPNVSNVIPMGINAAIITSGNLVDIALERLRATVNERREKGDSPALWATLESQKRHVQQMVRVLEADLMRMKEMTSQDALDPDVVADVKRALSPEFWGKFDSDPLGSLEFLENRIAPQVADGDLLYLRYVGTDLDAFQKSFDRMQIVDGGPVPPGQRGFLLSKFIYEEQFKIKNARRLDRIDEALKLKGKTIAGDEDLQRFVAQNKVQTREIVLQLDDLKTAEAVKLLQAELGTTTAETRLPELLASFFDMNDANFAQRYRFFYDKLAPMLELYRIRMGEPLTIKAFTRTGFVQSVNVPVYGTFDYKGLEKSPLAGSVNLMDLMTFRDLYGYLTAENREEMRALKEATQAKMVDRDHAEEELFGAGTEVEAKTAESRSGSGALGEDVALAPGSLSPLRAAREDASRRTFTEADIRNGVVLNAAVLVKDERKIPETIREIEAAGKQAGLELKAVSWLQAAGLFGGFILVVKFVLYIFVGIIVLVALLIINNALMMATLRRVRELGTLRAIGAQRGFVLRMVLAETAMLGLFFGGVGSLLGVAAMKVLGRIGIPAANDWLHFFFSGPRLHPTVGIGDVLFALVLVLLVSGFAILYPARLATRISPLQAMQTEE